MPSVTQKSTAFLLVILLFLSGCVAPGLEPAPAQPSAPAETTSPDAFSAQVRQAVEAKDFAAMRGQMDDNLFVIALVFIALIVVILDRHEHATLFGRLFFIIVLKLIGCQECCRGG